MCQARKHETQYRNTFIIDYLSVYVYFPKRLSISSSYLIIPTKPVVSHVFLMYHKKHSFPP
jgi:hypothetical protein